MSAELNRDTGSVLLPFDRFSLSLNELDMIVTASTAERIECSRGLGLPVGDPWPTIADPIYDSEGYFGPWTIAQARSFGFVSPATDRDLAVSGIDGAPTPTDSETERKAPFADLSDEEGTQVENCAGPDEELFVAAQMQGGPWVQEVNAIRNKAQALELPGMSDLVGELNECYQNSGLTLGAGPEPWLPRGTNGQRIDEQQIQMAVTVVDCKDSMKFTEQMAGIEARAQAVVIDRYADELTQERADLDDALDKARVVNQRYGL